MIEFFKALRERLKKPESFVLTSIVASSGSTPRGNGAKMAVFEDGSTMGTIGGGNVEYLSTKEALR
ncbi:MAG: XdhC family protein, partial [Catenibacillus sp.]